LAQPEPANQLRFDSRARAQGNKEKEKNQWALKIVLFAKKSFSIQVMQLLVL
jgi:hypothetical protein